MKNPKTIKGYISLCKRVANIPVSQLKGYEKLSDSEKILFGCISAEIDNVVGEFEDVIKTKR